MRILKYIFLIFLALILISVLLVFFFLRSFDINQYRTQAADALGRQLGRDVTLGQMALRFDFRQGVVVQAESFEIANPVSISPAPFLSFKDLRLELDFLPILLKRELIFTSLYIHEPELNLIRDQAGRLNIPLIDRNKSVLSAEKPAIEKPNASHPSASPSPAAGMRWSVQKIVVEGGRAVWEDRQTIPQRKIMLHQLDLNLQGRTMEEEFQVRLKAALASEQPNIFLQTRLRYDLATRHLELTAGRLETDLSSFDLNRVKTMFPELKTAVLPKILAGRYEMTVERLAVDSRGVQAMSLKGQLRGGQLGMPAFKEPFKKISADYLVNKDVLDLSQFGFTLGSGAVNGSGRVKDLFADPATRLEMILEEIKLGDLIPPFENDVRFVGRLNGQMKMGFSGMDGNRIRQSLSGEVALSVSEPRLENLNLLRLVLDRISIIPDLAQRIYTGLPDKYKAKMQVNATVFYPMDLRLKMHDGILDLNETLIKADEFDLSVSGQLFPDGELSLKATLFIPEDLSASMVQAAEELRYLLAEDGRLVIPFRPYRGPVVQLRLLPDLEYLSKRILVNRGAQEIERLLDDVFERDEDADGSSDFEPTQADGQPEANPEEGRSPGRQLIENVLDSIFN